MQQTCHGKTRPDARPLPEALRSKDDDIEAAVVGPGIGQQQDTGRQRAAVSDDHGVGMNVFFGGAVQAITQKKLLVAYNRSADRVGIGESTDPLLQGVRRIGRHACVEAYSGHDEKHMPGDARILVPHVDEARINESI